MKNSRPFTLMGNAIKIRSMFNYTEKTYFHQVLGRAQFLINLTEKDRRALVLFCAAMAQRFEMSMEYLREVLDLKSIKEEEVEEARKTWTWLGNIPFHFDIVYPLCRKMVGYENDSKRFRKYKRRYLRAYIVRNTKLVNGEYVYKEQILGGAIKTGGEK